MNDAELGRIIASVAPELPTPPDRLGAVRRRIRRHRNVMTACATGAVGIMLVTAAAILRPSGSLADGQPPPVGANTSTSTAPADDVLRTSGCAADPTPGRSTANETSPPGNSDTFQELNKRIVPYATANFADVFALTAVTDIGRLRVHRKPSTELDTWIMTNFAQDCVEIADAKASAAEMSQWSREIEDDRAFWTGRGIRIRAVGGSPVDGVVQVFVSQDALALARQEVPQRYPHLRIAVLAD